MESTIVIAGTSTGTDSSNLPTLGAFGPRAFRTTGGSFGARERSARRTVPAPKPIFDPTQDVTSVRIT
jgi:hypothetical protein